MSKKRFKEIISDFIFGELTIISPFLNTRIRYRRFFKKKLNLNNPTSFVEKLLWLKLYNYANNPLVKKCADKYLVRDYVTECGFGDILIPLIGVYKNANEIKFDELPNSFVLKWNFGCGFNIVCADKKTLDYKKTIKQLNKWKKNKYYKLNAELQYKNVDKVLLCEQYLTNNHDFIIPDYKVYCFNGEPKAILVMHDRGRELKTEFFDINWKTLVPSSKYKTTNYPTKKPKELKRILEICRTLSHPFPFVRIDFYIIDEKIYFGEMTFTPAGGMYVSETLIDGKDMGELLSINPESKY